MQKPAVPETLIATGFALVGVGFGLKMKPDLLDSLTGALPMNGASASTETAEDTEEEPEEEQDEEQEEPEEKPRAKRTAKR